MNRNHRREVKRDTFPCPCLCSFAIRLRRYNSSRVERIRTFICDLWKLMTPAVDKDPRTEIDCHDKWKRGRERHTINPSVTVTADGLLTALDTGPKQSVEGGTDLLGEWRRTQMQAGCWHVYDYEQTGEPDVFKKCFQYVLEQFFKFFIENVNVIVFKKEQY